MTIQNMREILNILMWSSVKYVANDEASFLWNSYLSILRDGSRIYLYSPNLVVSSVLCTGKHSYLKNSEKGLHCGTIKCKVRRHRKIELEVHVKFPCLLSRCFLWKCRAWYTVRLLCTVWFYDTLLFCNVRRNAITFKDCKPKAACRINNLEKTHVHFKIEKVRFFVLI